jgi:DNA-binding transcriptional LysR family regulator
MVAACKGAGFEPIVVQEATSTGVAVSFVAAELGVTLLPEGLADGIDPRAVVARPLASPSPKTHLLTVHRREPLSPTARAFVEIVQAHSARRGP